MEPGQQEESTQYFYKESSMSQDRDDFAVIAQVTSPIIKKEALSQHVVYTVVGEDKYGLFEVVRRFSDFDHLRRSLLSRWPSCYVPPLPDKKSLGGMEQKFIEDRRNLLEGFIKKIGELKHLWYSEEFQIFVRGTNPDIEKVLAKLPVQSHQDLIQKYGGAFQHLSGKEINPSIEGKIEGFQQYLRRINQLLLNYKEFIKKSLQLRQDDSKQQDLLISYLLPEYERNCLSEYTGVGLDAKLVFSATSDQKFQQLHQEMKDIQSKDELNTLYQLIRQESKEIIAFIECMEQRKIFKDLRETLNKKHRELKSEESKLISGKSSLKNVFSKKSKEESQEIIKKDIENTETDIVNIGNIYDIMTVILGYIEIDRFKEEKEALYFSTLKHIAKYEIQIAKLKSDFWSYVLENHNISTADQ